jgi:hypothetical protein
MGAGARDDNMGAGARDDKMGAALGMTKRIQAVPAIRRQVA